MSELTEGLEKIGAFKNKQKRLHNVKVEETKRLEIKERFGTEKRRLDLEKKQMMMEEKIAMGKIALDEKKFAAEMGRRRLSVDQTLEIKYGHENEGEDMELDDNNENDSL